MNKLTKKYIFEQKLKGEPIKVPRGATMELLVEHGILKPGDKEGRYYIRYPVMLHGCRDGHENEDWEVLDAGRRFANQGDDWW